MIKGLQAKMRQENLGIASRDGAGPLPGLREQRLHAPTWPTTAYAVKLMSYDKTPPGLAKARDTSAYARQQPVTGELRLYACILVDAKAYSVCVGPFERRNDPQIEKVLRVFRRLPGPRTATGLGSTPFAGAHVEKVGKLGRVQK